MQVSLAGCSGVGRAYASFLAETIAEIGRFGKGQARLFGQSGARKKFLKKPRNAGPPFTLRILTK
jgi:hypothetical protein